MSAPVQEIDDGSFTEDEKMSDDEMPIRDSEVTSDSGPSQRFTIQKLGKVILASPTSAENVPEEKSTEAHSVIRCAVEEMKEEGQVWKDDGKTYRYWVFVINNYNDEDVEMVRNWGLVNQRTVATMEVGAKGTPHIQGYTAFKGSKRFAALKLMHNTMYWAPAKSKDADFYPLKQGSKVICVTDNRKQGARKDIADLKANIMDGATDKKLWDENTALMLRYEHRIPSMRANLCPKKFKRSYELSSFIVPKLELKKSTILKGPPRIGKTNFAKAHFESPLIVSHMDNLIGFSAERHDGIIFEDMNFLHLPRSTQLFLVENDDDRSVHCRNYVGNIPGGTKKIFCTNEEKIFNLDDLAISDRVVVVEVNKLHN